MENENHITRLIQKYVANGGTPAEREELSVYLRTMSGRSILEDYMNLDADLAFDQPVGELDPEISRRIYSRIEQHLEARRQRQRLRVLQARWWRMAAAVAGICLIIGAGYKYFYKPALRHYVTGAGQLQTVILPDGSRVVLNSNSSISYEADWAGSGNRIVELDGEAFFDVAHQKDKPFLVNTHRMVIKVLGTAFNVNSRKAQGTAETTLVRGKVTIRDREAPEKETILMPNERAVLTDRPEKVSTTSMPVIENAYWHRGQLIFEDEPISTITEELEKWYHVKITLEEDPGDCRFNFHIGEERLPEVLKLLEEITGATSNFDGKTVSIKGKLCEASQP